MEKIATDNNKQQKISLIWTYKFRRRILGCYTDLLKKHTGYVLETI